MASQNENGYADKMNRVNRDNSIEFGRILAHPDPGEEVVISGLSGRYPDSKNVHEFRDNLFNKVDMVSGDSRRWKPGHPEIPQRTGKIPDIHQFDAGFFGIHHRQATQMDPLGRMLLEVVLEAIFDAGFHPSELEGTNTGVFVGSCFSESEKIWFHSQLMPNGFAVTGNERSMMAHRVSNFLKLKGPSFICDTACSSSLYALENAYKALRMGECDKAIVGGNNLCLHPYLSLQFARLGVLSADGACKAFDETGNGYARSEAVSAIVLQKSKDAKRIYSTILHAKTNCDGYKNSGITYPSGEMQVRLLNDVYEECDSVKSSELSFLEAHGTGTKVGDPEELHAIEEVFLKGRSTPLLIGTTKSNIGHTEPSSGLCSLTKAIIATETGYIPPNLHYKTPRSGIKSLEDGKLKVVTDKTPFSDNRGLIGLNSFGFGGGNCHIVLKQNGKPKLNKGRAKDNIPRLVCVSGRTKESVDTLLDDVIANHVDVEHVSLLHEVFRKNVNEHLFRGYSISISKSGDEISRSISTDKELASNLVLCFGNVDMQTIGHATEFLELPIAVTTLQRIRQVLDPKSTNIMSILTSSQYSTVLDMVLATFTLQVLFADILKACDIVPDKLFGVTKGFSLGSLVCAYFDDALTLQEATECAYEIARVAHSIRCGDCSDITKPPLIDSSGEIAIKLQQALTGILRKPRRLSKKVIFESFPAEISPTYLASCFGGDFVLGNVGAVLQKGSVIFEVGNGEVSQLLIKKLGRNNNNFYIKSDGGVKTVLSSIGRLYEVGFNPQIQNLYPKIEFPVSRGTPMISPKIKWNHDRSWWVTSFDCDLIDYEEKTVSFMLNNTTFSYMKGHVIDGRNLLPATGYLQLAWETLASIHGLMISDMTVVFENCKFRRATPLPKDNITMDLRIAIQRGSGNFEITEGGVPVMTGRIYHLPHDEIVFDDLPMPCGVNKDRAPYMSGKDVYKELRLRGYKYSGLFKGINSCDSSAQVGNVVWDQNWVSFMDNMLQMKILQEDTRLLYVPTSIQRLVIDAKRHIKYIQKIGHETEHPLLPVYAPSEAGIIRSGGIEIRGLIASSIARRKYLGAPVIEKYEFVPNDTSLTTPQAVRVNLQILLENIPSINVKVVELMDDETPSEVTPLGDIIYDVLGDQPLIQPDIIILSKNELDVKHAKVEDKKLLTEVECSLVVGSKILQRSNILQLAFGSIKKNGFVLSREPLDFAADSVNKEISIVTVFTVEKEKLVLFRKSNDVQFFSVIKISSEDEEFSWLPKLQDEIARNGNVVVCSQGEPLNGILGLVSCIRREPGGQNVRLLFTSDSAPQFDSSLSFYSDQLNKDLAINVYKDDQWGTYRHLLLDQVELIETEFCYLNTLRRGDLSSLTRLEAPSNSEKSLNSECSSVDIHYSAINFRDVMTAMGKINADSVTRDRREQECVQGLEYSGITQSGERVMGIVLNGALGSHLVVENELLWVVPPNWTLEEAATVPVVYATTIFGLINRGKLKRGETLLIHSGTGGIGLAAIEIALHLGCIVYTTVGTPEKRVFLKERFPQLKDQHISNSRTTDFEKHIMTQTNGRGVDIVLNSLAEEKLLASVRCLAKGGRFVEIGKFDLANDNTLNLLLFEKGASFHGFMLDTSVMDPHMRLEVRDAVGKFLRNDLIRPLPATTFKVNEAEAAFRYMTTGKHIGKVLIKMRKEEKNDCDSPLKFLCKPRYYCDYDKTYIICGGLGGFGLELADWLILRGCRNLVLSSRSGIKRGYQAYRISIWRSYGCTIKISTDDITTYEGCVNLIKSSSELGPIHAIFNLAVVLKDAIFENQSVEAFKVSFGPKANATIHLDMITRELCPQLRDFVVFSSVSCGRGNPGQSNYGMSNSVMERICEQRRKECLPALAIEWGAVGDVGLVADMQDEAIEMEIGGTLQQSIMNCLELMDTFLRQSEAAVVSSIVVAEKKSRIGGTDNIVDAVALILGVKDLHSISLQATLAEIGMDSMTAVEIKQTLELEHEVLLTPQDIKAMTFSRLIEIQTERDAEKGTGVKKERALAGMNMIIRLVPDEIIANTLIVPIEGKPGTFGSSIPVVIFPGIEGLISVMKPLYTNLQAALLGLQFPNNRQKDSIEEMAEIFVPIIEETIRKDVPFKIVCYSYGGSIALETVKRLEQKGYYGTVICIDGAPNYLRALTTMLETESDEKLQVSLLVHLMTLQFPYEAIAKHMEALVKCNTFEDKIKFVQSVLPKSSIQSPEHQRECAISLYKKLKALMKWTPEFKLKSKVVLFKPSLVSVVSPDEVSGLADLCEEPVEVRFFEGNHLSILENPELAQAVNETFDLARNNQKNEG